MVSCRVGTLSVKGEVVTVCKSQSLCYTFSSSAIFFFSSSSASSFQPSQTLKTIVRLSSHTNSLESWLTDYGVPVPWFSVTQRFSWSATELRTGGRPPGCKAGAVSTAAVNRKLRTFSFGCISPKTQNNKERKWLGHVLKTGTYEVSFGISSV